MNFSDKILESRKPLLDLAPAFKRDVLSLSKRAEDAAEGGCGVLGLAANVPIAGKHVLSASTQMHNRGNGKGGGIAMVGLAPAQVGVDTDYPAQRIICCKSPCSTRPPARKSKRNSSRLTLRLPMPTNWNMWLTIEAWKASMCVHPTFGVTSCASNRTFWLRSVATADSQL